MAPLTFIALLVASVPGSDRLVLKDGRELVGRLEAGSEQRVRFHSDDGDELDLARTEVRTIVRADEEPGLLAPIVLDPPSAPPPATWIRFDPPNEGPGHLLTGVARLFDERTRTTLFLVGAVHIGEPEYYAQLQDVLDSCDVVLFEGVGGGRGATPGDDAVASMDALTKLQVTLKDVLGLQFQRDGLDYRRPFWKNADVDFATLSARMKQEGVGLPTDSPLFRALMNFVVGAFDLSTVGRNPAMQRALRRQTAAALAMSDTLFAGGFKKLGSVLVEWRNDAALAALDRELAAGPKDRWIAIFYGAAHLPDLAAKVAPRGFEFQRADWIPAWTVE